MSKINKPNESNTSCSTPGSRFAIIAGRTLGLPGRSALSHSPTFRVLNSPRLFLQTRLSFVILLSIALSIVLPTATAQHLPKDARANVSRVPFLLRRTATTKPAVERIAAVGMTVSDMDRSIEFYSKVLSFEKVSDVEVTGEDYERLQGVFGLRMRVVRMKLGSETIELTEYLAPKGRPYPIDSRGNDRWFQHIAIITSDMEKAYSWLREHRVEHASTGPQRLPDWNRNAGGIKAFYFRDPDKHYLEILQFPQGKGDPRWQRSDKLFLGIDHTAIVVRNTELSLKFYRDLLGLTIAGSSENYGVEQEHLNNVFGARLRITSLRAPEGGPGIEFLEYLAPRDGRAAPMDTKANDLVHWQTSLIVTDVPRIEQRLRNEGSRFISPHTIMLSDMHTGVSRGLLVRDPDGHVMALLETAKRATASGN
jgi:catechol 2,3-dioxygenase-like lactoylglutathione lyase family enzyme